MFAQEQNIQRQMKMDLYKVAKLIYWSRQTSSNLEAKALRYTLHLSSTVAKYSHLDCTLFLTYPVAKSESLAIKGEITAAALASKCPTVPDLTTAIQLQSYLLPGRLESRTLSPLCTPEG